MNGPGEKKPSSAWKRIRDAAPATPAKSGTTELVQDINNPIRQAENAARIGEKEMQGALAAIRKIEQEIEELKRKGADKDEWAKALGTIKSEQANINRLSRNLQSARDGLSGTDQDTLTKQITTIADEVAVLAERLERARKDADAVAVKKTTPEPPVLGPHVAARAKRSSAPSGGDTETALHHGFERVADTGDVQAKLEKEMSDSRERVNHRVLEIFDVLDKGSARLLNEDPDKEVYKHVGKGGITVVQTADLDEQLDRTATAMKDFVKIVGVLPQLVENLKTDLDDSEGRAEDIAKRIPPRPFSTPRIVPPFDRDSAPRLAPPPPVNIPGAVQMPQEPGLEHGAGEVGGVHSYGGDTVREIKARKEQLDMHTITMLKTINEILSKAFGLDVEDGVPTGAYAYKYDTVAQRGFMEVVNNTWVATRDTARALVPPMKRLVEEIAQLISESREAREAIARKAEEEGKTT